MFYIKNLYIICLISILAQSSIVFSQSDKPKISDLFNVNNLKIDQKSKYPLNLIFSQSYYINTNLPNLENRNGYYFPKGYGVYTSAFYRYRNEMFLFTMEPTVWNKVFYNINLPQKDNIFSVLNDVPLNVASKKNNIRNFGIKLYLNSISIGYGNWNQWWGPGIHNSLSISNNAEGFYHYFIENKSSFYLNTKISYHIKYLVSTKIENLNQNSFYLSSFFLKIKYSSLELGFNKNILSGGSFDIPWRINDALTVLLTNKNTKYWDSSNIFYLKLNSNKSGLEAFIEIGYPSRTIPFKYKNIYSDHARASNLGLRKKGAFGSDNLIFGLEYTRLVESIYYNLLPTSNWYDNIKYNYSSYNGRRWAAHSGSDSDDFLVFMGYLDHKISVIYGLNYERHGVSFHFPPEVKIESIISASCKLKNINISLIYENEYFEHYGFVDNNTNIWNESFENGSLQRTKTLLFKLERIIF